MRPKASKYYKFHYTLKHGLICRPKQVLDTYNVTILTNEVKYIWEKITIWHSCVMFIVVESMLNN